jgi:hypothetical protein
MGRRALPFQVEVSSPCPESWETMTGTARRRHCDSCNKHVHNFAVMRPAEIERTIIDSGGHICARLTRRMDGSLVTIGSFSRSTPARMAAGIAFAAALSISAANAEQTESRSNAIVTGKILTDGSPRPLVSIVTFSQRGTLND